MRGQGGSKSEIGIFRNQKSKLVHFAVRQSSRQLVAGTILFLSFTCVLLVCIRIRAFKCVAVSRAEAKKSKVVFVGNRKSEQQKCTSANAGNIRQR